MSRLLSSLFTQACSHQFTWPRRTPDGVVYQVCLLCGDCYRYDWNTMTRGERIDVLPEPLPSRIVWKPRSRRIRCQEPMMYRVTGNTEWESGTVQNISESGVSFIGEQPVVSGVDLELIFVMPQEITGQRNSKVLCRGEVARVAGDRMGHFFVAVVMSGYSFLPED